MNILITGRPGCGKSFLISKVIEELKRKNRKIAGIVTPEIRKGKTRYGFKIIDLASSQEEILASIDIKPPRVSKYGVNVEGIDKIVDKFLLSFDKADFIIIDEIGSMELHSEKFKSALDKIFSSGKTVIATVHRNLKEKYKSKGKMFWLEREDFERIFNEIKGMLE